MKKIVIVLLILTGAFSQAQNKNAKANIEVDGVCMMCKFRIEKAALKTKGLIWLTCVSIWYSTLAVQQCRLQSKWYVQQRYGTRLPSSESFPAISMSAQTLVKRQYLLTIQSCIQ